MQKLHINGEEKTCSAADIPALLAAENIPQAHWQSLAVARNGQVVPRGAWPSTTLADGDKIEIVKPFVGG